MAQEIDRTVELSINGMTCGHSGATSKATVVTNTELDDNALRDAVSEAGFELVGIARDF